MKKTNQPACWLILAAFLWAPAVLAQSQPAPPEPPEPPPYNPYLAEKNVEVGRFYLKKGNYDAAIDRFKEALLYRPNFAKPYLYLGEAYEKKGEKPAAVENYEEYLKINPRTPDAKKIQKRIDKLKAALAEEARKQSPKSP